VKIINLIKYTIISIIYLTLIINHCNSIENRILFKVNNEIITSLDILTELEYLKTINKEFKKIDNNKAFEISKNSLIKQKIKEIEIKKKIKEIIIEDKILNKLILNYFNEFKIKSILEFEEYFLEKKIDPNLIRRKITIELLWNQLIVSIYKKNIRIDKELIKSNLSNNKKQKEFLISEILFNVNENESLDIKFNLIEESIKKINFSQTALAYSISNTANKGGTLGWVTESILSEKIYGELKGLKNGEYTKPIVVPGGFLILQLADLREVVKDFNMDKEVKKIIEKKTNQQLNRFSNIYFNKVKKEIAINEL
jgi:peptidyl-prolyl cis-trans isomerase SurA